MDARESGWKAFVHADEVPELYRSHEICSHSVTHRRPWSLPADQFRSEILEDRQRLEELAGYPVRGFALPYGWRTGYDWCKSMLRSCGFHYLRNSQPTLEFELPGDFLAWQPTCHCSANLPQLWAEMLERAKDQPGQLFYVFGHSYEFEDTLGWNCINEFSSLAASTPDTWFATKGDIFDYVNAWRRLSWSLDGQIVRNPSSAAIWFLREGRTIRFQGGDMLHFEE